MLNGTQITILIIGIFATAVIVIGVYPDEIAVALGTAVGAMLTGIFARMADPDFFKDGGAK